MFKEVHLYSVEEMAMVKPLPDMVVVSILDKSEEHRRPSLVGFRDVLKLQFYDTWEETKLAKPESWPDEPRDDEHRKYGRGDERIVALSDAQAIVAFLDKHHQTFDQLTLVTHCYGGISRSAAVATWAAARYWAPITSKRTSDGGNPRLIRLLNKAANRH